MYILKLTFSSLCGKVACFIPTALHLANLQAAHFRLVTLSILQSHGVHYLENSDELCPADHIIVELPIQV